MDVVKTTLGRLGQNSFRVLSDMGRAAILLTEAVFYAITPPYRIRELIYQVYFIGLKSMFVICLTAVFTGMVLGLQGYYTLVKYGSEGVLGAAVALSLIRELGPVLTTIMVSGRAGSAIAAEIGIMRITEQIDALHTMDINPIRFLVVPRLLGAVIAIPVLTAIFDVVGIFGGYLSGSVMLGINPGIYFYRVESSVSMSDINNGFIKAVVFSIIIAVVCCYEGYYSHLKPGGFGARGVSNATTSAVVMSCIIILVADYVLTSLLL